MRFRTFTVCAGLVSMGACIAVVAVGCCTPGNQAPVAHSQVVAIAGGVTTNITVTAVDPDSGPGPISWTLLSSPTPATEGTLHDPAGVAIPPVLPNVAFTPAVGFTGCAQFTFQVSDGDQNSGIATVSLAVDNVAPTAADVTFNVGANISTVLALSGTDPDNCPPGLTAQIVVPPTMGTITAISGLTATYVSTGDNIGTDTFVYTVSDGLLTSAVATATVNIAVTATGREILLTLQNADPNRYIHYHLHLITFAKDIVTGDESRYTSFGYVRYPTGVSFGCYNFAGRDLYYYYHRNGRFRTNITNSSSTLLSGISPAISSASPRKDVYFMSRVVPLPSMILFHDPKTTVPAAFNVDRGATTINPALSTPSTCAGCASCAQASWYYVTAFDQPSGVNRPCSLGRNDSNGPGRYFRVPAETQQTACWDCVVTLPLLGTDAAHWLHNSAINEAIFPRPAGDVSTVLCNEFYLGSVVTYTFTNAGDLVASGSGLTAQPSLQWSVQTRSGTAIHSRPAS